MVAVWWLVKYHGLYLKDAWDLVRKRRDSGAHWKDVALGGECPPDDYVPDPKDFNGNRPAREFQHPIAGPGAALPNSNTSRSAAEKRPYPKAMWYRHAAMILQPYFKRHWHESDIKSPPRAPVDKPKPPPANMPALSEAAHPIGSFTEVKSLSSGIGNEKAAEGVVEK